MKGWKIFYTIICLSIFLFLLNFLLLGFNETGLRVNIRWSARISSSAFLMSFIASTFQHFKRGLSGFWVLSNRKYFGNSFAVVHTIHLFFLFCLHFSYDPLFVMKNLFVVISGGVAYAFTIWMFISSFEKVRKSISPAVWSISHSLGMYWIWAVFIFTYFDRVEEDSVYWVPVTSFLIALIIKFIKIWRVKRTLHILLLGGLIMVCVEMDAQDSQIIPEDSLANYMVNIEGQLAKISFGKARRERDDNLYLNPEWQEGVVLTLNSKVLPLSARYSLIDNSIEIKYGNVSRLLRSSDIHSIQIGKSIFIPAQIKSDEGQSVPTFVELIYSGKLSLYKRYTLKARMKGSNPLTSTYNGTKEYYIGEDYYVGKSRNEMVGVKLSKKKLMGHMKDKEKEIKSFIIEEKVKLKSQEDFIVLFKYYDSLVDLGH